MDLTCRTHEELKMKICDNIPSEEEDERVPCMIDGEPVIDGANVQYFEPFCPCTFTP